MLIGFLLQGESTNLQTFLFVGSLSIGLAIILRICRDKPPTEKRYTAPKGPVRKVSKSK